jgi:glyoxylase-like metal-dependent hydrolase (beta-lactamase superfamily II)
VEFTTDPPRNRESARRLAALEPALVCFGHGPPLRDAAKFASFVESLPD